MIILCDIDDTLTNFGELLLKDLNTLHGTSHNYDDMTSWNWFINNYDYPWAPCEKTEFWDRLTFDKKAIHTLEDIIRKGNRVYLCSASFFDSVLAHKIETTLSQFNPKLLNSRNVIICHDKKLVHGDIRIDDNPENMSIHSINLLLDKPWNRDCNLPWMKRCNSWDDVSKQLENLCSHNYYE